MNQNHPLLKIFLISIGGKAFQHPKIMNESSNSIEYGAKIKLICKISGYYTLSWKKNAVEIESDKEITFSGLLVHRVRSLTINRFIGSNEGVYVCQATRTQVEWQAQDEVRLQLRG